MCSCLVGVTEVASLIGPSAGLPLTLSMMHAERIPLGHLAVVLQLLMNSGEVGVAAGGGAGGGGGGTEERPRWQSAAWLCSLRLTLLFNLQSGRGWRDPRLPQPTLRFWRTA